MKSPACTRSPSFLSHAEKVPSSMDQPSRGTVILTGISLVRSFLIPDGALLLHQIPHRSNNFFHLRDNGFLQWRTVGRGHKGAVQATNGSVEVVETSVHHTRGDLSG